MKKRGNGILKKILAVVMTVVLVLPMLPQMSVKAYEDVSNDFYSYKLCRNGDKYEYAVSLTESFKNQLNANTDGVFNGEYSGIDATGNTYMWSANGDNGDGQTVASIKLPNPAPNGCYKDLPVTGMSYLFVWFTGKTLDISNFNTSNVANMVCMFAACQELTSLNLGNNFNTSNVSNMSSMFSDCIKLESLNLGENFDTSNVSDMACMFYQCMSMKSISLGNNFDTSNVDNMAYMFYNCYSMTSLNLGESFDTSNVGNMAYMFDGCNYLTSLNLGESFDTSNVSDMSYMFTCCNHLTSLNLGESFDTSNVSNMGDMFYGCMSLTSLNLGESFDTSGVNNMSKMFFGCSKLTGLDLSNFDLSTNCDLQDMFDGTCSNTTGAAIIGYAKDAATAAAFNNASDDAPAGYTTFLGNTGINSTKLIFQVKPTAIYIPVFTPIADITDVPVSFDEDTSLTLSGTVSPSTATNKTITWSLKDAGETGATLDDNVLTATNPGTLTVTATVKNGSSYTTSFTKDFKITVNKVIQKPGPLTIKATTLGRYSVKLTWSASTDAASYKVYRATKKNGPFVLLETVTGTSKIARKLSAGKSYWFKVVAVNEKGTATSKLITATTKAEPVSFNLTTGKNQSVNVKWNSMDDVAGYQIACRTVSAVKWKFQLKGKDESEYICENLKAGKTYQFKMRYYTIKNGKKVFSAWTAVQKTKID